MGVLSEITSRTAAIQAVLDDSNAALTAKGGNAAKALSGLAAAITALPAGGGGNVEAVEWTPGANTNRYDLKKNNLKYCIISDKSTLNRPNSAIISLVATNAEFFAGYKPIIELKTGFQGGIEQNVNYYRKALGDTYISASANFIAGRKYDVILIY